MAREFISPKDAAEMFGVNVGTLANLRVKKEGPRFYKGKRKIFYALDDFRAWLTANPVQTKGHTKG